MLSSTVKRYMRDPVKLYFGLIKNSGEIFDKLKASNFNATSLPTYDFSTLYTTLPRNLTKDKRIDLIEGPSIERALLTLHVTTKMHFLHQKNLKNSMHGLVKMFVMRLFVRQHFYSIGTKLYRQVAGIFIGTNCAHLVADLFLFCCEKDFMMSLSDDKQADIIDAFNTSSRYLDDILNINNVYFYTMVSQIYPSELPLIQRPRFYICICQFLLILFLPKFMINVTTLILKLSIPHF